MFEHVFVARHHTVLFVAMQHTRVGFLLCTQIDALGLQKMPLNVFKVSSPNTEYTLMLRNRSFSTDEVHEVVPKSKHRICPTSYDAILVLWYEAFMLAQSLWSAFLYHGVVEHPYRKPDILI